MDFRRKGDAVHVRRYVRAHAEAAEAYFGWCWAHHNAWAAHDYTAYFHSVAAIPFLHDGVAIEIRA